MTTQQTTRAGCDGQIEVTLLRIEGGGHTWPGGDASLPERLVDEATRDWDRAVIWEFLARFER